MLGKAHLKRAILGQEEALRLHAVCRALRRVDLLQAVLAQALRRSLARYSELDLEDDFLETTEAPDIPREQPRPSGRVCPASRRQRAGQGPVATVEAAPPPGSTEQGVGLGRSPRGRAPLLFPTSLSRPRSRFLPRGDRATGRPPSVFCFTGACRLGWSSETPGAPWGLQRGQCA